jgi:hypothetical protein
MAQISLHLRLGSVAIGLGCSRAALAADHGIWVLSVASAPLRGSRR